MEHNNDNNVRLMYGRRFGQIAVNMRFATPEQIRDALTEQTTCNSSIRLRPRKLIGEILFENGWMTVNQIEKVLEKIINYN